MDTFFIGVFFAKLSHRLNDGQYFYDNYYFFLFNNDTDRLPIPRFSSIFLEPGHLGMITTFLIYANQFDLKGKKFGLFLLQHYLRFH